KGPGSSLYGAGTGGVLSISSLPAQEAPSVFGEYAAGSYGLQNIYGSVQTGTSNTNRIGFQHQVSDGYRTHSKLQRDVLSWNGRYRLGEHRQLQTTFLYGKLFYQTPGGLTAAEFQNNPQAARPPAGGFPGAVGANASV